MFQRRKKIPLHKSVQEFFWPSMGWRRTFLYVKHRILRLSDSTHKIALGLSFGLAVSFSPLLGTHFIQAAILAYIFRANILTALLGTFFGNPWTFPFMWWASISLGSFLFGIFGLPVSDTLPQHASLEVMWDLLRHDPRRILFPWLLGGYLSALLSMPVTYAIFFYLIRTAKAARHAHLAAQAQNRAQNTNKNTDTNTNTTTQ